MLVAGRLGPGSPKNVYWESGVVDVVVMALKAGYAADEGRREWSGSMACVGASGLTGSRKGSDVLSNDDGGGCEPNADKADTADSEL